MDRETIAREAFWGGRPALMALVLEKRSYEMDGVRYPANGATLAEVIETVKGLPANEFLAVAAVKA